MAWGDKNDAHSETATTLGQGTPVSYEAQREPVIRYR